MHTSKNSVKRKFAEIVKLEVQLPRILIPRTRMHSRAVERLRVLGTISTRAMGPAFRSSQGSGEPAVLTV
jgi:hypothetical protein